MAFVKFKTRRTFCVCESNKPTYSHCTETAANRVTARGGGGGATDSSSGVRQNDTIKTRTTTKRARQQTRIFARLQVRRDRDAGLEAVVDARDSRQRLAHAHVQDINDVDLTKKEKGRHAHRLNVELFLRLQGALALREALAVGRQRSDAKKACAASSWLDERGPREREGGREGKRTHQDCRACD